MPAKANRNEYQCTIEVNQNGKYCVRVRAVFTRKAWTLPVYFLASTFDGAMTKLEKTLQFLQQQEEKLWFWGVERSDDPKFSGELVCAWIAALNSRAGRQTLSSRRSNGFQLSCWLQSAEVWPARSFRAASASPRINQQLAASIKEASPGPWPGWTGGPMESLNTARQAAVPNFLLLLFYRRRWQRHIRIEHVAHRLPLAVSLLSPNNHVLTVIGNLLALRIVHRQLVCSDVVTKISGAGRLRFGALPADRETRIGHELAPYGAYGLFAGDDRHIGRQHGSIVGIKGNRFICVLGRSGLGPLRFRIFDSALVSRPVIRWGLLACHREQQENETAAKNHTASLFFFAMTVHL